MMLEKFRYCPVCGADCFTKNDGRSKRCRRCGFTYYVNASGAYAALITDEKGRLLVVRRGREPAKGTLDLPGGFANPGESAEEGVAREVLEETGLNVKTAEYLFSIPNSYEYSGITIPTLDLFFKCEAVDTGTIQAQDDAEECLWVSVSEISPEDFGLSSIRQGVARYVRSVVGSKRGE